MLAIMVLAQVQIREIRKHPDLAAKASRLIAAPKPEDDLTKKKAVNH
jgi:hypothetical protein